MPASIIAKVLLEKSGAYVLGEPIKGKVQILGLHRTNISEVGLKMFLDDGGKDVLISQVVLGENISNDHWQDVLLDFSFDEATYETFLLLGHDLKVVLEPYIVMSNASIPVFSREKKALIVSDHYYEILDDELLASIPFSKVGMLIFGVIAYQVYNAGNEQFRLIVTLVVIGLLIVGLVYLTLFFVLGRFHFHVVPVDEKSFNVVSDNTRIWSIVEHARMWYRVDKRIKTPGNDTEYKLVHRSKNTFATRETGLWANMKLPDPPTVPATIKNKSIEVDWALCMEIQTKIGFNINYRTNVNVKKVRKLPEKSAKDIAQ